MFDLIFFSVSFAVAAIGMFQVSNAVIEMFNGIKLAMDEKQDKRVRIGAGVFVLFCAIVGYALFNLSLYVMKSIHIC
ncbi:hypothetical protein [Edwardsiella tarda]|uniref:Uncharacterized protein n=1 Tax=Edwardsiella tarda TaxID=636 RepID=A0A2A7U7D4_EDWTA|nr:hypothetical protein [Edwardsiella tarda]PEH74275.1 hypothetical protein CRM76_01135 [Edwardsiella tarda]